MNTTELQMQRASWVREQHLREKEKLLQSWRQAKVNKPELEIVGQEVISIVGGLDTL